MPIAEARIETDRASRYLVQLSRHAQQMGRHAHFRPRTHADGGTHTPPEVQHVEWSDTHGTVRLSLGEWTMRATTDALTLRVEAAGEDDLRRIQELVGARLERIGRRDHLTVVWERPRAEGLLPGDADETPSPRPTRPVGPRRHSPLGAVGGIVALILAAHVVLGGSAVAAFQRLGWGVGAVVVVLVLAKVVGIGALASRHGRPHIRKRIQR